MICAISTIKSIFACFVVKKRIMSTNSFGYELETVASNYIKYRATYPMKMYDRILKYLDEDSNGVQRREVAVDVGCGSGQSTWLLAKTFDKVIGIDSSEAQLTQAKKATANYKNITYRLGQAENLSEIVGEGSVDLITAGAAIHWFDTEKFYSECLKVLKVGGTFAAFVNWPMNVDNAEANDIIHKVFKVTLKEYFTPHVEHVYNSYRELYPLMPKYFRDCTRDDSISTDLEYSLEEFMGVVKSTPQYEFYKADHPEDHDAFSVVTDRLRAVYGTNSMEDRVVKFSLAVALLMGKK